MTADLTQSMIKSFKVRKFFAVLSSFAALVAVAAFCYWTIDLVEYAFIRNPKTPAWKIPLVLEYIAVLFSFIVMTIYALRDFCLALARKPDSSVEDGGR
ncbi:MAG: TRAP transporter small permease subunit [Synergistaceae bacterium]|nr:TRAP transporter small permease subunit [Synergistaceae bacterium]